MPQEPISDALIMHAHAPMRQMLTLALMEARYHVVDAPTYAFVLQHLRSAAKPVVVVAGNIAPDYHAEAEFFRQVAADAALTQRHRYVLLTTVQEWLPGDLDALLRMLRVPVLAMPSRLNELLATVAEVAGRTPIEDESAV